jgi:hypothetical protein
MNVVETPLPVDGRDLRIPDAVDRVRDVLGGDRGPVLPPGTRVEPDVVDEPVGGCRPRGRDGGDESAVLVDPDQRPEDEVLDPDAELLGRDDGIEGRRVPVQVAGQRIGDRGAGGSPPAGGPRDARRDDRRGQNPERAFHRVMKRQ